MDSATPVTLRIEAHREPIQGLISLPDGSETSFEGYVELVAVLERVRDSTDTPPDPGA